MFTAAQAAQKFAAKVIVSVALFTAAQAAQKIQKTRRLLTSFVHCRTGSSEII